MSHNLFVPRIGAVFSADIAVPEHEGEVRFYSRVLATGEHPLWREEDLMNSLGLPIIGLGARTAEHDNLPLQWMPHIQVADVAASVQRAVDLGGAVLARAPGGASQWAVLRDPVGAAFGIIPVVPMEALPATDNGAEPEVAPHAGRIYWLDLTVPDAVSARDFYSRVIGWTIEDAAMMDGDVAYTDYTMVCENVKPAAGICHARGTNAGLPAVWILYLPVGDLVESMRRVEAEGGSILQTVCGLDDTLIDAVIADPVGACIGLVQG